MTRTVEKDVVIIGAGAAGLAAAIRLYKRGVRDLVIIEREDRAGGILRQCIHDGFGLIRYKKTLSGPEFAQKLIDELEELGIPVLFETTVTKLTKNREITAVSKEGLKKFKAKAVILTTGSRERTRESLSIPGSRPAGIYTAGVAQEFINLRNKMIGKNVIVLGSGDIGLIMARRLTLEGAKVLGVFEILPYPSGLDRNIKQCLNDYDIPLHLSQTVTEIHGKNRINAVTISEVDKNRKAIPGTEKVYECDSLVLSVGLTPENELAIMAGIDQDQKSKGVIVDDNYQTGVEGIFAAGNALHIHDLVDYVSAEAERLAESVADYLEGKIKEEEEEISLVAKDGVSYTVPQHISGNKDFTLSLRAREPMEDKTFIVEQGGREVYSEAMKEVLPAEMLNFNIKAENIRGNEDLEVFIR